MHSIPDKAEVGIDFPDKLYIGGFGRDSQFEAKLKKMASYSGWSALERKSEWSRSIFIICCSQTSSTILQPRSALERRSTKFIGSPKRRPPIALPPRWTARLNRADAGLDNGVPGSLIRLCHQLRMTDIGGPLLRRSPSGVANK
jgi:hypothetical protein